MMNHAGESPKPTAEAVARVRELHRPVEIEPSSTICHECSHQLPGGDYAEKVTEWPCATLDALAAGVASQGRESDRPCTHVPKGDSRRAGECHRCAVEAGWTIASQEPSETKATPYASQSTPWWAEGVPAPSTDREKLIAEAQQATSGRHAVGRPWPAATGSEVEAYVKGVNWGADLIHRMADALVAQPVLDPEKVAAYIGEKIIDKLSDSWTLNELAEQLCEAAKRSELT